MLWIGLEEFCWFRYSSSFSLIFNFHSMVCWNGKIHKMIIFFMLINSRSGSLAQIFLGQILVCTYTICQHGQILVLHDVVWKTWITSQTHATHLLFKLSLFLRGLFFIIPTISFAWDTGESALLCMRLSKYKSDCVSPFWLFVFLLSDWNVRNAATRKSGKSWFFTTYDFHWIIFPTKSCLLLYSFCTSLLHLIMGLVVSSLSPNNLHLVFCQLLMLEMQNPLNNKFFSYQSKLGPVFWSQLGGVCIPKSQRILWVWFSRTNCDLWKV